MAQQNLEWLPSKLLLVTFTSGDSNFDGRHSNFFWAIIHLFLHPFLKQISPRITQESTTTHTEKSIKNPWIIHCYVLHLAFERAYYNIKQPSCLMNKIPQYWINT